MKKIIMRFLIVLFICVTLLLGALWVFIDIMATTVTETIETYKIPNSKYTLILKYNYDHNEIDFFYSSKDASKEIKLGFSDTNFEAMPTKGEYEVALNENVANISIRNNTTKPEVLQIIFDDKVTLKRNR